MPDSMQRLLNCPFEVKQRSPCDPLYRLISVEEEEDGTVIIVLELVEEETSVIGMGKDAWMRLRQAAGVEVEDA